MVSPDADNDNCAHFTAHAGKSVYHITFPKDALDSNLRSGMGYPLEQYENPKALDYNLSIEANELMFRILNDIDHEAEVSTSIHNPTVKERLDMFEIDGVLAKVRADPIITSSFLSKIKFDRIEGVGEEVLGRLDAKDKPLYKRLLPTVKKFLKAKKAGEPIEELETKIHRIAGAKAIIPASLTTEEKGDPELLSKTISCIAQVKKGQPPACARKDFPRAEGCFNPFAVCRYALPKENDEILAKYGSGWELYDEACNVCDADLVREDLEAQGYEVKIEDNPSGKDEESRLVYVKKKKKRKVEGIIDNIKKRMKTRTDKQLLLGHSLTHSEGIQKSWGCPDTKKEHSRLVEIMKRRAMDHDSPFVCVLPAKAKKRIPYLEEEMNWGGEIRTRGSVIAEMQKEGATQKQIDAYMMGYELGEKIRKKHLSFTAGKSSLESKKITYPDDTSALDEEIIMPDNGDWVLLPYIRSIMDKVRTTLSTLNRQFGTDVGLKFVPVEYLRKHKYLKSSYMGFVKRDEPYHIYTVPENILTDEQAIETTKHEFKHALDLVCNPGKDYDCPINPTPDEREARATAFEKMPIFARPSGIMAKAAVTKGISCPICEVQKGKTRARQKLFEAMREIQAAEGHIAGLQNDITKRLREQRKIIEGELWSF